MINTIQYMINTALNTMTVVITKVKDFLINNEVEKGIVIFSCNSNMKFFCEQNVILMENTFGTEIFLYNYLPSMDIAKEHIVYSTFACCET